MSRQKKKNAYHPPSGSLTHDNLASTKGCDNFGCDNLASTGEVRQRPTREFACLFLEVTSDADGIFHQLET